MHFKVVEACHVDYLMRMADDDWSCLPNLDFPKEQFSSFIEIFNMNLRAMGV